MASLFHTHGKYIKDVAHTHTQHQHSLACAQPHFFHHTIPHTSFHKLLNDTYSRTLTHNRNAYKLDMLQRT